MTPEDLAQKYPYLYHVTDIDALNGIEKFGLLTAADIVSKCNAPQTLVLRRRSQHVRLCDCEGNHFVLSDNKPLSTKRLDDLLDDGLTVEDWLRMLANRVFFWVRCADAMHLRKAHNHKCSQKLLLKIETRGLVARHFLDTEITPFNTGATIHQSPRRGLETFALLKGLDYAEWQRRRAKKTPDRIKEVVVRQSIPGVLDHVIEAAYV